MDQKSHRWMVCIRCVFIKYRSCWFIFGDFFKQRPSYRCYSRIEVIVPVFSYKKYIIRAKMSIINQNIYAIPSILFTKAEKSYFLPVWKTETEQNSLKWSFPLINTDNLRLNRTGRFQSMNLKSHGEFSSAVYRCYWSPVVTQLWMNELRCACAKSLKVYKQALRAMRVTWLRFTETDAVLAKTKRVI